MIRVNAYPLENSTDMVTGIANLTINDNFKLDSIRIIKTEKGDSEFFLGMPAYKTDKRDAEARPVYKDLFHPANKEFISELYEAVKKSLESGEAVEIYRDTVHTTGVKAVPVKPGTKNTGIRADVTLFISREGESSPDIVIDTVKIRENTKDPSERKIFVAFPARKTADNVYKSVCYPVTAEKREELLGQIFTAYHNELDKAGEAESMKVSDGTKDDRIR